MLTSLFLVWCDKGRFHSLQCVHVSFISALTIYYFIGLFYLSPSCPNEKQKSTLTHTHAVAEIISAYTLQAIYTFQNTNRCDIQTIWMDKMASSYPFMRLNFFFVCVLFIRSLSTIHNGNNLWKHCACIAFAFRTTAVYWQSDSNTHYTCVSVAKRRKNE